MTGFEKAFHRRIVSLQRSEMSIEHDSSPRLHSSGVQCRVLRERVFTTGSQRLPHIPSQPTNQQRQSNLANSVRDNLYRSMEQAIDALNLQAGEYESCKASRLSGGSGDGTAVPPDSNRDHPSEPDGARDPRG